MFVFMLTGFKEHLAQMLCDCFNTLKNPCEAAGYTWIWKMEAYNEVNVLDVFRLGVESRL